jgi:alpha-ketoglutarate-dependent taurine dioxygenase
MDISSLPEWTLSPVKHVQPGDDLSFPLLVRPEREGTDLIAWLEVHRAEVDRALSTHGAVLLRGFRVPDEAAFERAARALCSALEPRYGDLVKRESAEFIYDATWYPKDRAILFHNEGAHTPELPTRQLFFCGRAEFTGGETPIVDCRRLYRALGPALVRPFESKGLLYVRNFIRGVDVRWQDFFRTDDRSVVEQRCRAQGIEWTWKKDGSLRIATRAPAVIRHPGTGEPSFFNQVLLHHVSCLDAKTAAALRAVLAPQDLPRNVCFGDGSPIPDETIMEVLKVTVQTAVRFTWRLGDIALLDNLATAHARSPFEGDRQILVAVGDIVSQRSLRPDGS